VLQSSLWNAPLACRRAQAKIITKIVVCTEVKSWEGFGTDDYPPERVWLSNIFLCRFAACPGLSIDDCRLTIEKQPSAFSYQHSAEQPASGVLLLADC
jgi:hypothetical protein